MRAVIQLAYLSLLIEHRVFGALFHAGALVKVALLALQIIALVVRG